MKNQAILTAFDGDFAMYFNPSIDVSPANAVRFSSNFIFEGKDGITKLPSYRKFKKIFKYYKGLCLVTDNTHREGHLRFHISLPTPTWSAGRGETIDIIDEVIV